jgi:cell division protein FtsQ
MLARALDLPRTTRLSAPGRRFVVPLMVLVALAGGYLWLRDSSLVRVDRVLVTGTQGVQATDVQRELEQTARGMTTLHVDAAALRDAVKPFAIVADVKVDARFPHTLHVQVIQHQAVGLLRAGGQAVPVAADGALLHGAQVRGVPDIAVRSVPAGARVQDGTAGLAVALLAAAPRPLLARVARVFVGPRGLTARLADGPAVYFGGVERVAAKWAAASAVLAAPSSQGATDIDVRYPERPAAGALEQATEQQPATGEEPLTPTTTPAATVPQP